MKIHFKSLFGLIFGFALLAFLALMPVAAQEAPLPTLFLPTEARGSRPLSAEPAIRASRRVVINWPALKHLNSQQPETLRLSLSLLEGKIVTLRLERVERRSATRYSWFGRVEGLPESMVILVAENEALAVQIFAPGQFNYALRYLGDNIYLLADLDMSKMGRCATETPPCLPIPSPGQVGIQRTPTIDVLIVYTAIAQDAAGGVDQIHAQCQLAVDNTNVAYANSQVNAAMRLVRTEEITYNENGTFDQHLDRLTSTIDSVMDQVHDWRDYWGADLVSLFVDDDDPDNMGSSTCGKGWIMWINSTLFADWGFSIVNWRCAVENFSFAHETGHNMGCGHDRDNGGGLYDYSHGHRFNGNDGRQYRTVMAYAPGERIQYFSNPNVSYLDTPTGIADGNSDSADNARTLNHTAGTAADFRTLPDEVWVDFDYRFLELGTELFPFNTMEEAQAKVHVGGTVWIKASSTRETPTLIKPMTVRSVGGTARIGSG